MFLVGNVNVENLLYTSVGVAEPLSLFFNLPRKTQKRRKLKVKYFGFHAGVSADNPNIPANRHGFLVFSATQRFYSWRLPVGEVQMEILAQGDSISHENVGVHHYSDTDESRNTNRLRYITSQACEAQVYNAVGGRTIIENHTTQPSPWLRGHSEMSEVSVGFVETNTDQLEVRLTVLPDETEPVDTLLHSFEPNVRMDSISFVLELV